jgi:hypothetical protein
MNQERVAIVGTAESWTMTPWNDPGLKLYSLNDAYRMKGFQRADAWYDFHPLDKFFYPPTSQPVYAHQIPFGFYARPQGHLEWLAKQTMPVWLHPDFATQHPEAATWPHAHPFPRADIEGDYGDYETSSPAWMIAHAMLNGVRELHIYGIHLATEFEYVKQRPNFEFFCGCILGRGKRTLTRRDGKRYYESKEGLIVIPEASPILRENFQYAFDPKPDAHLEPLKWELHKVEVKKNRLIKALMARPTWSPWVQFEQPGEDPSQPPFVRREKASTIQIELAYLTALSADWQDQLHRAQFVAQQG